MNKEQRSMVSVKIITPEGVHYEGSGAAVQLPSVSGVMTLLAGHTALYTQLNPGNVTIVMRDHQAVQVFVQGGIADVGAEGVVVVTELATPREELTAERLMAAIESLEAQYDRTTDLDDQRRCADSLAALKALNSLLEHPNL